MIGVVVVTHGHFGQELLRTVQDIAGRQEKVAAIAITSETGPESLNGSIDQVLEQLRSPEGTLFLVDMMGGSPCNAVLLKTKDLPAEVVTGVNLYMLLSAFRHRDSLALKDLANKVTEDGKRAILQPKDLLLKKLA